MMKPSYWLNDKDDEVQMRFLDAQGVAIMVSSGWTLISKEEFERYERVFLRFKNM